MDNTDIAGQVYLACYILIHTGKYIKNPLYLMFNRKNSMYHVKYRYNLSYFWHTFLIQIV